MSVHMLLTALLGLLGGVAQAHSGARPLPPEALVPPAPAAAVEVEVIADDGTAFPLYFLDPAGPGTSRAWLEAREGAGYTIRVRNRTGARVALAVAVDGRNVISGEPSNLLPGEPMYVLGPHASAHLRGWRTASDRVHRFFFTEAGRSYAAAWADRSAMGVIAVAAYRDRVPEVVMQRRAMEAPAAAARESQSDAAQPGTGFGESEWSPTRVVRFEPESAPVWRHFLKYEWRETLVRMGVVNPAGCAPNRLWPPPGEPGFAPYPPGYPG